MRPRSKRASFVDDCLLAGFALTLTAVSLTLFGRIFSWQAAFAMLFLPTCLLCRHLRYRAAAFAAATSLLTGAWIIVPPRWSLRIEPDGVPAVILFACAATLTVALTRRASQRRAVSLR